MRRSLSVHLLALHMVQAEPIRYSWIKPKNPLIRILSWLCGIYN
jgi:hypothetical protein